MPWLRLWCDILDSEKIADLDDNTYRGWTLILIATKRHDAEGVLPPLKKLAYWLRRPESIVRSWIESLTEGGFLERDGESIRVHDWDHWQEPKDKTAAKRMANMRARKKVPPAPPEESDTDTEQSREGTTVTAVTPVTVALRRNAPPAPRSLRDPEDQKQFDLALEILRASLQTEHLAMELGRCADLPGVVEIKGWQWIVAAKKATGGKGKKAWPYFKGIAANATEDEYADVTRVAPSLATKTRTYGIIAESP